MTLYLNGELIPEVGDKPPPTVEQSLANGLSKVLAQRDKLRAALELIDSQAVAAVLAQGPHELLDMLENIQHIAEKALER
jgi:hypothetical protein